MAERLWIAHNGARTTTGDITKQATGTTMRTMMQLLTLPSRPPIRVVEVGYSMDASALAGPGILRLLETGVQGASGANFTNYIMPISTVAAGGVVGSSSSTTLNVAAGNGTRFANVDSTLVLSDPNFSGTGSYEKVLCTARATDALTVTRNIDNDGALTTIAAGWDVCAITGTNQADITPYNNFDPWPLPPIAFGSSGFASGAAGSPPATDLGNVVRTRSLSGPALIEPIGGQWVQYPLSREPEVQPGAFVRLCADVPTTSVNLLCYMIFAG